MTSKPTGQAWRNWKKSRGKARVKQGLPCNPDDWNQEWSAFGGQAIIAPQLPSPDVTAEELIEWREKQFAKKSAYESARKLIIVDIPIDGPYGVLHFGDPHVDDDGCDWKQLRRDIRLVQETDGLFASNVGDTRNNWVGRLARLYGQQSTSAKESLLLADYFLNQLRGKWAYLIGGNHDAWSGDDDPLQWITAQMKALYEPSEARIGLRSPDGKMVVMNARHDFAGNSQWNPTHAVMKAAQMGVRDDVLICGHKHQSGYGVIKDPETGKVCHCIQVASYKVFDRYAREKGFKDQSLSPCVMTVIDPHAAPINRVQVFWDSERGAEYLTWLRARK